MHKPPPRVALLIESSRTYGRGILRGIARYARAEGPWSVFSPERELHGGIPGWLRTWRGDGIIARIEDRRAARELLRLQIPVVDVLGSERFAGIPGFDTDAAAVAALAADYFLRAGYQHFAFCGYRGVPFSDRREDEFSRQLARHGRRLRVFTSKVLPNPPPHIQAVERAGLETEQAIAQWLKKQPRPLALLACNDIRAQQVLNACRAHGLRTPEDIAVMGVDNDDVVCNLCSPSLTSIEPDTDRLGYAAAALLARLMRGAAPPAGITQIPPGRIVERGSTDVVPVADRRVVAALRFIRDNLGAGISVKDVLAHAGRSRTDLENRFRRTLKTTIRAEILRQRLGRARQLLQATDLNLAQIAKRAGLSTPAHLCRLFRRHFKMTPNDCRRAGADPRPPAAGGQ